MIFIEYSKQEVIKIVIRQLRQFFMKLSFHESQILYHLASKCYDSLEYMFSFSKNKNFRQHDDIIFNPLHSGQYCLLLYTLSRLVYVECENTVLASKLYFLNKILNSIDLFYEVEMPKIFDLDHPLGTVLGRASYSDFFFFSQGCTVGNNNNCYPTIGENVLMLSGSKIIGNSVIGDNSIISANTYIKDQSIPPNSIVFGTGKDLKIVEKNEAYFRENSIRWKKFK